MSNARSTHGCDGTDGVPWERGVLEELKRLSAKLLDTNADKAEDESFINQASAREEEQQDGSKEETDDIL